MAKDERIFRVVKQGYRGEKIKYATRTAISAMFGTAFGDPKRPDILRVEAIDPADIEWTDVTDEFRNKPKPRCGWHPAYTGVRKPSIAKNAPEDVRRYWKSCHCWSIYSDRHPEYPKHDPLCDVQHADPETCSCQVLKKLTE